MQLCAGLNFTSDDCEKCFGDSEVKVVKATSYSTLKVFQTFLKTIATFIKLCRLNSIK